MSTKVTTQWIGGLTFKSDNPSGNTVIMDTEVEGVEERLGVNPKAAMLSSLAACTGIDVILVLEKMKVELSDLKMEVVGEQTTEHPKYYHKVWVDYHFYGKDLNPKKIEKAVNLSKDKYCGVMEMFRHFAKIETTIHIHEV